MRLPVVLCAKSAAVLLAGLVLSVGEAATGQSGPGPGSAAPSLHIATDPRIELVSLIFRLAGNPEYNQCKVESYESDVDERFGKFTNHATVELARKLRQSRGVSFDACMSLAVLLTDARKPDLRLPLSPWPESLDKRWNAEGVQKFLASTRQFVNDTGFTEFIDQHKELYETTETRLRELLDKEAHLEWFHDFFGELPEANFTVIPALLNGGSCYGPRAKSDSGKEELYCILGVWETDWHGMPSFGRNVMGTVVHEFNHSYANPIISRHMKELEAPGKKIYRHVAERMRSQAYGDEGTMLRESLVRACAVRYARRFSGQAAERSAIANEIGRGFLWTAELSGQLGVFETNRSRYPTLESFAPQIVAFFKSYADTFDEKQTALDAKRPKVVSIKPANGDRSVVPGLNSIEVRFDRPMRDASWSLVGGGPHMPETTGKPAFDSGRTVWSVPVKLKPDWDYEFMLNSASYNAFRSEEGVPLDPVSVKFRTRGEH